jgi:hypothetical protein
VNVECVNVGRREGVCPVEIAGRMETTPMDNFVCFRCQQEARILREVGAACDRQERRRKAA